MSTEDKVWVSPRTGEPVPYETRPHWADVTAQLIISVVDPELWQKLKAQYAEWRKEVAGRDPAPDAIDSGCGIVPFVNIRRRRDAELRTGLEAVLQQLDPAAHAAANAFVLAARLSDATRTHSARSPIQTDLAVASGDDCDDAYMLLYVSANTLSAPFRASRAHKNDIVSRLWHDARGRVDAGGAACIVVRAPKWLVEYVDTHNTAACVFRRIRAAILTDVRTGSGADYTTMSLSEVMMGPYQRTWDARVMRVFVQSVEVNLRDAVTAVRARGKAPVASGA